jgi:hypothetical protein
MPIPYNVFGGDVLWLALGGDSHQSGGDQDKPFSWLEANKPVVGFNKLWNMYYIQGIPQWGGQLPWYQHSPWTDPTDPPLEFRSMYGTAYDKYNKVIASFILWGKGTEPDGWPAIWDWDGYVSAISKGIDGGRGEWELFHKVGDSSFGNIFKFGEEVIYANESFTYLHIKEKLTDSLLIASYGHGACILSFDHGETWTPVVWAGEYDDPWEGGCNVAGEMGSHFCGGPPGSEVFLINGGNDVWKSDDLGASMHIGYAPYDWGGEGKWDPASAPAFVGDTYCMACNGKQAPDTVYLLPSYYSVVAGEKYLQRNLTFKCEPDGWETNSYYMVSEAYQDNIYEGYAVYPPDYPTVGLRGTPWVNSLLPRYIKHLPGSDRWWILGHDLSGGYDILIFSDDDGVTWSNILCDHTGTNNDRMIGFFNQAWWPFSVSYDLYLNYNVPGHSPGCGRGFVYDVCEHPEDPNIVVALGHCWWQEDFPIADPNGRWDGTMEPVNEWTATPEELKDILKYQGQPGARLNGRGMHENCIAISNDGGDTWGRPFSITPSWDHTSGQEEPQLKRLYATR